MFPWLASSGKKQKKIKFNLLFVNIQNLSNKINFLKSHTTNFKLSTLCICEHWLHSKRAKCIIFCVKKTHIYGEVIQSLKNNIEDLLGILKIEKNIKSTKTNVIFKNFENHVEKESISKNGYSNNCYLYRMCY